MKKAFALYLILTGLPFLSYAQDPDLQDSIIVETVFLEYGQTSADVRIYARTDDSVMYYGIPLTWYSPELYTIYPESVSYYNTILLWDDYSTDFIYDQGLMRMLGFSDLGGDENPPLYTQYEREHCWTIHFTIDPMASPQVVVIDTVTDPWMLGPPLFALGDGITSFGPAIVRGAIFYDISTGLSEDEPILPAGISHLTNYPNPFNTLTTLRFELSKAQEVELTVYDLLGRQIDVLIDERLEAGVHDVSFDASSLTSGVYFYRLRAGDADETKRMVLLK
jgi:hypothetical protein